MTILADLDSSLVLLIYRYALSCVRRDRAVSRRWHEMLPTCRKISLPDTASLCDSTEQALRRSTEWDR